MSLSTTATNTHLLAKYSRSYPSRPESAQEWQHFVNPVIRLVLDVKKSAKNDLESVRLRVLWFLDDDQKEYILVSLAERYTGTEVLIFYRKI